MPAVASAEGPSEEEKASQSLYNKGRLKFDAGDWVGAEDLFAKSLAVYPNAYARLYRAASLARLARCDESRAELARFAPEAVAAKAREKAKTMVAKVAAMCAPTAKAPSTPVTATPASATPAVAATEAVSTPAPGAGTPGTAEPGAEAARPPEPVAPAPEKGRTKAGGAKGAIVVSPDGQGDFARLEDALAKAKAGAVIHVNAGIHRLSRPVDVTVPMRLVGDGRSSVIVGDGEGHVLRFTGKGPYEMHDLAIEHQGGRWARVIVVEGAEVDFRGLKVSGGVRDAAAKRGGEGLLLLGDASGTVTGCEFSGNALHGVKLAGKAHPLLEGNTSLKNGKGGMVWFEESGGTARANTCSSNGQYGMAVVDKAAPKLVGNACADNRRGGLYLEAGRVEGIQDNRCDPYLVH